MTKTISTRQRIWNTCCSLKLAIIFASLVTLLTIYGSLLMHAHPEIYATLDQRPLGDWFRNVPDASRGNLWWLYFSGVMLLLLGLNTCCCFLDWVLHLKSRWRKTGEYLIHCGFVMVLIAFVWGSLAGSRQDSVRLFLHQRHPIAGLPQHELIVDGIEPRLNQQGRPLDMLNQVRLVKNDQLLLAEQLRINHPLLYKGLVIVPVSFGREAQGFNCFMPGAGTIRLLQGQTLQLSNGKSLKILSFYANARKTAQDTVIATGADLQNPAMQLELSGPGIETWRGWYFLREQLPYQLIANGIRFWPTEPIFNSFTILTINHDPGAHLALAGGCAILTGTLLALVSFYRKRRMNDRPQLD